MGPTFGKRPGRDPMTPSAPPSNSRPATGRPLGSLTRRLGRSGALQAAGTFLRTQVWAWPVLAALLLAGVGRWMHGAVEGAMRQRRAAELSTILEADVTSLGVW